MPSRELHGDGAYVLEELPRGPVVRVVLGDGPRLSPPSADPAALVHHERPVVLGPLHVTRRHLHAAGGENGNGYNGYQAAQKAPIGSPRLNRGAGRGRYSLPYA